jgi:hypothetical protein
MPGKRGDGIDMAARWCAVLLEKNGAANAKAKAWKLPLKSVKRLGVKAAECAAFRLEEPEMSLLSPRRSLFKAAYAELQAVMRELHAYFDLKGFPPDGLAELGLKPRGDGRGPRLKPAAAETDANVEAAAAAAALWLRGQGRSPRRAREEQML